MGDPGERPGHDESLSDLGADALDEVDPLVRQLPGARAGHEDSKPIACLRDGRDDQSARLAPLQQLGGALAGQACRWHLHNLAVEALLQQLLVTEESLEVWLLAFGVAETRLDHQPPVRVDEIDGSSGDSSGVESADED